MRQGAVTVFALAVPSVLSLLVLLRNEAVRGIEGSKLEWVRARVEEQCKLLEDGLPLTFPLDALLVCSTPPLPHACHFFSCVLNPLSSSPPFTTSINLCFMFVVVPLNLCHASP